MKAGVRIVLELLFMLAVVAGVVFVVRHAYLKTRDACSGLSGEQEGDCRYLNGALEDLADSTQGDLARVRCRDWLSKVDRFLRLEVAGTKDKARQYVEKCAVLNGGRL